MIKKFKDISKTGRAVSAAIVVILGILSGWVGFLYYVIEVA